MGSITKSDVPLNCRAWAGGHFALSDHCHPTSSRLPKSRPNSPSAHQATWQHTAHHVSDPYFIFICYSNPSQHYTCSFPTCQRIVPRIRKRLNMPHGNSSTPIPANELVVALSDVFTNESVDTSGNEGGVMGDEGEGDSYNIMANRALMCLP